MQPTLKSHLNNKPSGIPWVDTIPSHWAVRTLRSILRPVNERNHADLPLLSVVREQGVILRDLDNTDDNHNVIPEDLSNYKLVRPKQFAINKMKAWQGSYGVSLHEGIVSPAYFVFDVLDIDPAFLHRATRSKAYVPLFDRASDGVRIGQWGPIPRTPTRHTHRDPTPKRTSRHRPLHRPRRRAHQPLHQHQRAAHRPAGRATPSRHPPSCHPRARP